MTTNTVVLIVVAVVVALVLVGVVVGCRYKLRAERRLLGGTSLLDEVVEDARVASALEGIAQVAAKASPRRISPQD